ncbi:DUF3575 domain-containing protein [Vitiosangium sp. GDMCC 1.1324]|uniref:DUF3575 domain-containing protein n=1 Tax=Vitiosangium sp. (strain GDMCC 1.1324) TaxID=2138576 RepID=UPI00130D723B|nr:DUF3575 domain-containing protein [Vitiosangium sp. GDMCC 1.1324]
MKMWMRWGAWAAGVGVALVPLTGRAEEPQVESAAERRTVVMAQPMLYGGTGLLGAGVEHAVGTHVAISGSVQGTVYFDENRYGGPEEPGFSTRRWGVGVDPGLHVYLAGRAPEGFWVGPHLEMSVTHHVTVNQVLGLGEFYQYQTVEMGWRTLQYGGSVRAGYTAILSPGLTVQVGAGLAALSTTDTPFGPSSGAQASFVLVRRTWALVPRMTVGLGWAF